MCGIAGVVGWQDLRQAERAVGQMTGALRQRGPDGEGLESWDHAVLGHRRLAIFDVSEAGRQPMLTADRAVGVVFNGAIYNFLALRKVLAEQHDVFRSNTDTEVLLHGYLAWGIDGLVARLHGMFAFALWDARRQRLYLVRDRLGVKPLVFSAANGSVAFASTVRALRAAGIGGELDPEAMLEFLQWGFVSDAHTMYRQVCKVPAATIVEWGGGTLQQRRYWSPPAAVSTPSDSFESAVEATEELLLESVRLRLQADVPIGALLSGGIDSSLVCWAMTRLGSNVTAYTISTPGDPWDEASAACHTARALGMPHCVLEVSAEAAPAVEELVSAYAEPLASPSALGMLQVSRAMTSCVKVLLTGDGGDDVFLGYPRHRHLWLAGLLARQLPGAVTGGWFACRAGFPRRGPLRRLAALLDYTAGDLQAFGRGIGLPQTMPGLLGERLRQAAGCQQRAFGERVGDGKFLSRLLAYEHKTRFVGEYLTKVDGATMYYGLEARSPFLDQSLWEYAAALPINVRLRHGQLKALLRVLARRHLGVQVARRRKTGFRIPVLRWLRGRWRPVVEASLRDSVLAREGWLDKEAAAALLTHASHHAAGLELLWHVYILEAWMRHESSG